MAEHGLDSVGIEQSWLNPGHTWLETRESRLQSLEIQANVGPRPARFGKIHQVGAIQPVVARSLPCSRTTYAAISPKRQLSKTPARFPRVRFSIRGWAPEAVQEGGALGHSPEKRAPKLGAARERAPMVARRPLARVLGRPCCPACDAAKSRLQRFRRFGPTDPRPTPRANAADGSFAARRWSKQRRPQPRAARPEPSAPPADHAAATPESLERTSIERAGTQPKVPKTEAAAHHAMLQRKRVLPPCPSGFLAAPRSTSSQSPVELTPDNPPRAAGGPTRSTGSGTEGASTGSGTPSPAA